MGGAQEAARTMSDADSAAVESMVEELVDEVSASTEPVGGADDDDLEEQAAAAVKIQAVHRGKQARKELQEKREQEAAAVKIQAVHRGKQARKELEEKRRDVPEAPPAESAVESDSAAVESMVEELVDEVSASTEPVGGADDDDLEEQAAAAVKIQAVHRGKQARKELQEKREQEAAAVKIQAVHRGKQARKELEEKRRDVPERRPRKIRGRVRLRRRRVDGRGARRRSLSFDRAGGRRGQRRPRGAGCCGSKDSGRAQRQAGAQGTRGEARAGAAAVKIQAVHRGKQARKELEEKRRDVPEAPPAELVAREDPSTTDPVRTAFDKFDADGSDKLERGELLKVLEELGLDVSDGEFVAIAEALMEDYDADGNGELDFEEFKKLYAQCLESDETRKAYVEELRAAVGGLVGGALSAVVESDAAAKIQAVHRGKQARKELEEKREQEAAAVKIQAVHRGKQARKELEEKRRDVPEAPPAESAVESDSAAVKSMVEELVDEVSASTEPVGGADDDDLEEQAAAAVKIQAVHRGKQARSAKELKRREGASRRAAAVKIQAVHRGKQARKELEEKREMESAALKIQAVHRGKQARKELEEKREMESAALKIQAVHRGKQTRMELRKEREEQAAAALKIQAVHREREREQTNAHGAT